MRMVYLSEAISNVLAERSGVGGAVEHIEFIHHSHCAVYRVRVGGNRLIVHLDRHGPHYLERVRRNLNQLAEVADGSIPRVIAWESHDDWALLAYREIPGEELNSRNAVPAALDSLADLLFRIHSLPLGGESFRSSVLSVDDPAAFPAFSEQFLARISDLPLSVERIRRHLDQMAGYLKDYAEEFRVPRRPIHGDLHRSNVIVSGSRVGLVDWADLAAGDYAFDLATLKFVLDSIVPRQSLDFIRRRALQYRERFNDRGLEVRLRYYLALAGLVRAFHCAGDIVAFRAGRAWRARACYLHSEYEWAHPLRLDGPTAAVRPARTEDWALDIRQPIRGLFYLLAPKRVS